MGRTLGKDSQKLVLIVHHRLWRRCWRKEFCLSCCLLWLLARCLLIDLLWIYCLPSLVFYWFHLWAFTKAVKNLWVFIKEGCLWRSTYQGRTTILYVTRAFCQSLAFWNIPSLLFAYFAPFGRCNCKYVKGNSLLMRSNISFGMWRLVALYLSSFTQENSVETYSVDRVP